MEDEIKRWTAKRKPALVVEDGVDYFILESITFYRPKILILEYNPTFGNERSISVPYRSDFNRTNAHFSNLYFGASLGALTSIAEKGICPCWSLFAWW